jgi:hypothetical protein
MAGRAENEPVISAMRTLPVIGALVMAEKYPAIPRTMRLLVGIEEVPTIFPQSTPKMFPRRAPTVRRGKKIPPGVEEA